MSEIGLGANNFGGRLDEVASAAVIATALDHGVNLIDTADVYNAGRSEELVGRAIRGLRDQVVLATKAGMPSEEGLHEGGLGGAHLRWSVEQSLRRLGVDHVDLLQLHIGDATTPIGETLAALDDLVRKGLVGAVGCSNFWPWELAEANVTAELRGWPAMTSVSVEWSLLHREPERELLLAAARFGAGVLPYRPLAQGFLTGKYARGEPAARGTRFDVAPAHGRDRLSDANFDALDRLDDFAAEHGVGVTGLALGYLLAHDEVSSVIVGASTPEQLVSNIEAATSTDVVPLLDRLTEILPPLGGHRLGLPHLRSRGGLVSQPARPAPGSRVEPG